MKTNQEKNRYFEGQAIDKLSMVSTTLQLEGYPDIDICKLKEIFEEAKMAMRDNPGEFLYRRAENIFYSCVNVARCVLIDDPLANYTFIDGNTYLLDPMEQFHNTIRIHLDFKKDKENC
jgi:hypothetical protein